MHVETPKGFGIDSPLLSIRLASKWCDTHNSHGRHLPLVVRLADSLLRRSTDASLKNEQDEASCCIASLAQIKLRPWLPEKILETLVDKPRR